MALTTEIIKNDLEKIQDFSYQKTLELKRHLFYEGAASQIIMEHITKEYSSKETIAELENRLLPLNLKRKIINKASAVYDQSPVRLVSNKDKKDQEMLDLYSYSYKVNRVMRQSNRGFTQFKKGLVMPYVDEQGYPRLRYLPPHTYFPFRKSDISPQDLGKLYICINDAPAFQDKIFSVWTEQEHLIVDGRAQVIPQEDNAQGINPFGKLPFVWMNESNLSVHPIQNDDLWKFSIAVPILFSDLSYGIKYMAYSLIWTTGIEEQDMPTGPGNIIHTGSVKAGQEAATINQIKPQVEIDSSLNFISQALTVLLETWNLRPGNIAGKLTGDNAISGISKAIDESDNMEAILIQQDYFRDYEQELWNLTAHTLSPYWIKKNKLNSKFTTSFSDDFDVNIVFKEPKVVQSEKEKIEISKMRLDAGLTTLRRELSRLNPDMDDDDITKLIQEIREERMERPLESVVRLNQEM